MTLKQISVFVENKPGKLQLLTDVLAQNKINLRALSLAEASEFGIVRIIAEDIQTASKILTDADYIHAITDVIGVAIPDEAGGLNRVLAILSKAGINVEYMYAFFGGKNTDCAYMIFHVQEPETSVAVLADHNITCVSQEDILRA